MREQKMAIKTSDLIALSLLNLVVSVGSDNCVIPWMLSGHEVAQSQYMIDLSVKNTQHGMAATYFPDTQYDIIIRPERETLTFQEFYFKMENQNRSMSYGALELREPELSKFSTENYCINRVVNLATPAKPNITIGWQSPPTRSGCIVLWAHVKETDLRYHTANLTVCEDPRIELDDPGELLRNCCACERAKYEMTFEGMWSKFTHPRGFPKKDWLAGYPTVIGAAHNPHYKVWEEYENASDGLKKFVESGSSLALELEMKAHQINITTFIKFRGTNFKNKTLARAQLRVDRLNHVLSLVARINPSPDWFIGVPTLELCKLDCSWIENKTLNLYAYDAGSRSGLEFEQENNDITHDVINPMNMSWPLPRVQQGTYRIPPFYDKTNNTHEVRPMAQIHLRRIRTYGSTCVASNDTTEIDESCATEWVSSPCTVTCGPGFIVETRKYKTGYNSTSCPVKLEQKRPCPHTLQIKCEGVLDEETCQLSPWSEWTRCEAPCGQESTSRMRTYSIPRNAIECDKKFPGHAIVENKDCGHPPCPSDERQCNEKLYSQWTEWQDCSVTVGRGLQYRHRDKIANVVSRELDIDNDAGFASCLYEMKVCDGIDPASITEAPVLEIEEEFDSIHENPLLDLKPPECLLPQEPGLPCRGSEDDMLYNRWSYNSDRDECELFRYYGCQGNMNRFDDEMECNRVCSNEKKIDCKLSEWGEWSKCTTCAVTEQRRSRTILVYPSRFGKPCPVANRFETKPCDRLDCDYNNKH